MPVIHRVRVRAAVTVGLFLLLVPVATRAQAPPATGSVEASVERGDAYTHLMRALLAARRGENRNAATEIRRAIELQPQSADVRVQGATLLERIGRRSEALEVARDALVLDPDHPDTLRFLADRAAEIALSGEGDEQASAEARRYYERLMLQGLEDDDLLGKLATLRLQAGDRGGAIEAAQALVERRPGDRRAAGSLAQLLLEEGRQREALEILLQFLVKHPDDAMMLRLADDLTRRMDAWDLVEQTLSEQGGFGDRTVAAQGLLGEALLYANRLEEAVRCLEAAIASGTAETTLQFSLGRAYHGLGRLADAAVLFRQLSEETTGLPGAHARRILGETIADQGDVDSALEVLESAMAELDGESGPSIVAFRDGLRVRIASLLLDRDPRRAGAELAAVERPDEPEVRELKARVAIAQRDWPRARRMTERLRASNEKGLAAALEGEIHALTGRWGRAQSSFAESLGLLGNRARIRFAEICLEAGRADLGEAYLRDWIDAEPGNADAHYYLGFFLYRQDRFEEADREMRRAFGLDPAHGAALNFLGYSYAERNVRLGEALELIQRALVQNAWSGAYLDSLGWVYYQMGRYEEARAPLESAAREHPTDPTVLEHLGDLYHRLGDIDLALEAWRRALESDPDDPETLRAKIARDSAERQASSAASGDDTDRVPDREPPQMRP